MKKNIFTKALAVGALFFVISAQAEDIYVNKYTCLSEEYSLQVSQTINQKEDIKAKIILTNKATGEVKNFSALNPVHEDNLPFSESYKYLLYDGVAFPGTLEISKQQHFGGGRGGFCGRAGCDFPKPVVPVYSVYAALKLGEYEDSFVCNQ